MMLMIVTTSQPQPPNPATLWDTPVVSRWTKLWTPWDDQAHSQVAALSTVSALAGDLPSNMEVFTNMGLPLDSASQHRPSLIVFGLARATVPIPMGSCTIGGREDPLKLLMATETCIRQWNLSIRHKKTVYFMKCEKPEWVRFNQRKLIWLGLKQIAVNWTIAAYVPWSLQVCQCDPFYIRFPSSSMISWNSTITHVSTHPSRVFLVTKKSLIW